MAHKKIFSVRPVKQVHPTDEHIVDPDIPVGDTAEEVGTRWAYLTNKYGNDNICYRPSKGEK